MVFRCRSSIAIYFFHSLFLNIPFAYSPEIPSHDATSSFLYIRNIITEIVKRLVTFRPPITWHVSTIVILFCNSPDSLDNSNCVNRNGPKVFERCRQKKKKIIRKIQKPYNPLPIDSSTNRARRDRACSTRSWRFAAGWRRKTFRPADTGCCSWSKSRPSFLWPVRERLLSRATRRCRGRVDRGSAGRACFVRADELPSGRSATRGAGCRAICRSPATRGQSVRDVGDRGTDLLSKTGPLFRSSRRPGAETDRLDRRR